jgi:hypothetical protein
MRAVAADEYQFGRLNHRLPADRSTEVGNGVPSGGLDTIQLFCALFPRFSDPQKLRSVLSIHPIG